MPRSRRRTNFQRRLKQLTQKRWFDGQMMNQFLRHNTLKLAIVFLFTVGSVGFEARATSDIEMPDLIAFDGNWQRVDETRDEERREAAINRAVEGMSWLIRGFAGSVLRRSTRPPKSRSPTPTYRAATSSRKSRGGIWRRRTTSKISIVSSGSSCGSSSRSRSRSHWLSWPTFRNSSSSSPRRSTS